VGVNVKRDVRFVFVWVNLLFAIHYGLFDTLCCALSRKAFVPV